MTTVRVAWGVLLACALNCDHQGPPGSPPASAAADRAVSVPPNLEEAHMAQRIVKTDAEWRKSLTPEQYRVCREKGTERAGTGAYVHNKQKGVYVCVACGQELFASDTKFDSGTGWPSFWAPLARDGVKELPDDSHGMRRVEVMCGRCDSHLGHVFNDGPRPTGLRYCINSVSLKFTEGK